MKNYFDFGLELTPEKEKELNYPYLNKKTIIHRPLLSKLIDTAYKVQSDKILTEQDLLTFEEGLYQTDIRLMCHYSGKFLCNLSYIDKRVQELFLRLINHKNLTVRKNIIINMLYEPIQHVMDYVLEKGLLDKSSNVRGKTADVIGRNDLKYFIDKLQTAIKKEENENTKTEMSFCLYWLTNDYELIKYESGRYGLTVKTISGSSGATLEADELKHLDKIIKKIKEDAIKFHNRK